MHPQDTPGSNNGAALAEGGIMGVGQSCESCGAPIAADAQFCEQCGRPVTVTASGAPNSRRIGAWLTRGLRALGGGGAGAERSGGVPRRPAWLAGVAVAIVAAGAAGSLAVF
jgi:uncharacterized OB-fold protein